MQDLVDTFMKYGIVYDTIIEFSIRSLIDQDRSTLHVQDSAHSFDRIVDGRHAILKEDHAQRLTLRVEARMLHA